jgi:glycosyltransferase involved in cell wall biosynthesis
MKIVHIVTGLGDGGAEHTLFKICKQDIKNKHIVISFKRYGKYFSLLNKLGIKVYCLNASFFSIHKFFFLIKLLQSLKPDIVQTWLVHADLVGSIAARLAGIKKILWNVRYSNIEIDKSKLTTILIIKALAKLSYIIPEIIVINSKKAKKIYESKGYDKRKLKYIPNGYDLSTLKVSKSQKIDFQKKIKIKKQIPLIGYVARYDPLKDHLNLLNALSLIRLKGKDFFCILVGSNINKNKILINEIKKLKLNNCIRLLGPMNNVSKIMNSLDIHILSSASEGFPNVVAEAMAHKTPCVVTNVGDSSYIVGKTGWVVPPNDSIKLAKAIETALNEIGIKNWNKKCNLARVRIKQKFSIDKMIKSYNKSWIRVYKKNNKKPRV